MATFEDLKQRLRETAEVIGDVSADLYKRAESKTKILARTAKLQAENASDRTAVKRLYQEIGKAYYESHRLYPEPELEQSCAEVTTTLERIEVRKKEIDALRASSGDAAPPDADVPEDVPDDAPEAPDAPVSPDTWETGGE
ncbi:MAG: hypothetical protein LBD49_02725 [Oscillospiraceae bacterium]|jgi:hypothetical protein|nr:hypothetical protein [Oscillospiraceae bacterium]